MRRRLCHVRCRTDAEKGRRGAAVRKAYLLDRNRDMPPNRCIARIAGRRHGAGVHVARRIDNLDDIARLGIVKTDEAPGQHRARGKVRGGQIWRRVRKRASMRIGLK